MRLGWHTNDAGQVKHFAAPKWAAPAAPVYCAGSSESWGIPDLRSRESIQVVDSGGHWRPPERRAWILELGLLKGFIDGLVPRISEFISHFIEPEHENTFSRLLDYK
jgi:hypothetical protein